MSFLVQYSGEARANIDALPSETRRRFDDDLARLAGDPYGMGSTAIRERDYRQALLGGCVTVYYVGQTVRVVSVVRVQGPP